jgi:hypothetical protein
LRSPPAPSFPKCSLSLSLSFFPSRRERRGGKRQRRAAFTFAAPRREEKKKALLLSAYLKISRGEIGARERKRDNAPLSPFAFGCSSRTKKNFLPVGKEKRKFSNMNILSTHLFSFLFALRADFLGRRANGRVSLDGLDSSSRGNFRANEGSSQHD